MNNEVKATGMVRASGLHFGHPGRALWAGASHDWPQGVCLIEGDEGSGKTSLLQVLAGHMALQQGQLQYAAQADGQWVNKLAPHDLYWQNPRRELSEAERQHIVGDWVAQQVQRYPLWSQAEFERHAQVFDLQQHLHKPLLALSTGSQRKLWLAGAWASGAALTLIDEPFAALDRPSERHVLQTLVRLSQSVAAQPARCFIVAHWDAMQGVQWADVLRLPGDRTTPLV